jgi:hypothetical protein
VSGRGVRRGVELLWKWCPTESLVDKVDFGHFFVLEEDVDREGRGVRAAVPCGDKVERVALDLEGEDLVCDFSCDRGEVDDDGGDAVDGQRSAGIVGIAQAPGDVQ